MRERPTDDAVNAVFLRITPARAGKTSSTILSGHIQQDHPRSCGKDMGFPSDPRTLPGSPPLVRERRSVATVCRQSRGITPARAGKTRVVRLGLFVGRDHPRSCGKDRTPSISAARALGSPPLVRERPYLAMFYLSFFRITPARAGKTVMDPFICAISLLPVFKIYLISFQSISTLQLLRNLGGC